MDKLQRCENCTWWERTNGKGYCHRYAPVPTPYQKVEIWSYPVTLLDGWCGDWTDKNNLPIS